jgi:multiple sugar transport system permease protein
MPRFWRNRRSGFRDPDLDNFRKIFGLGIRSGGDPGRQTYFMNSLIIALTSTVIALLIGMAGGYAFARYRFRGKGGIFLGLMLTRAVPGIALSLPVFISGARWASSTPSWG